MAGITSTLSPFFEAAFQYHTQSQPDDRWTDASTDGFYIFMSRFGTVHLRKRQAYPATFAYVQGNTLCIGYGEHVMGQRVASNSLDIVPEDAFYYNEFLYMEADLFQQRITVQRDAPGTLPIFVCAQPQRLIMSNKFEQVCAVADRQQLHVDDVTVSQLLTGQSAGRHTLIREVRALLDRARLVWTNGELREEQAPVSSLLNVTANRTGDALAFHRMMEAVIEHYRLRYARPGVGVATELSGGTDSAVINRHLVNKRTPLVAGTLLYPDEYGRSQLQKLTSLESTFGLMSYRVPLEPDVDYPMATAARENRWRPFYHNQELYLESYKRLADYFVSHNASVVFRGIGGDELGENIPDLNTALTLPFADSFYQQARRPADWGTERLHSYIWESVQNANRPQPLTLVSNSVATAQLAGNNQYLDHNIWPVMPLANPALYLYCQTLPIRYRSRKNLIRAYMKAVGFPPNVYASPVTEDFGFFFYRAVRPNLQRSFEELMQHSVLARAGLINPEAARQTWGSVTLDEYNSPNNRLFALYRLLTIEMNLQALGIPFGR